MAEAAQSAPTEALAGLVERVTYHNAETGFCVLRVKARGQRELITVVGHAASIAAGEWVQMSGSWVNDRTHGLQFRAGFLKATAPTTVEGIEKYLGSGMIRGIGPVYARKLVQAFGAAVFDLIEAEPDRLREVTGIGPRRAARIVAGWAEQKVIREIMLFLHANGVGTSRAVRIYRTYGANAVQVITENPYRLARDIRGIGFRTADQVARRLGIEPTAMIRVRAGISFALAEATGEGHCGLPVAELTALTGQLLEVPAALIETALRLELEAGEVVADTLEGQRCVFLAGLYRAEQAIAERLRTLAVGQPPWPPVEAEKAIPWVRGEDRPGPGRQPARGAAAGAERQAAGDHRRPGGGQDHPGAGDPAGAAGQAGRGGALRPHRPRRQAALREHRAGGADHPPPARDRPEDRRLQAGRGAPARLRPAGGGRDQHGGRAADAGAAPGPAGRGRAAAGGRRGPAALGRAGAGAGRCHRLRAPCRWCG